ncbi:hypothetical protein PBAL39_14634 [Pedobacter sp. BAL39]|uniref:alpha/beta hydrolase family protein n=1 Tax=Pedobacter sp. BAL39 TaxID=391596 RepID=UPI00015594CE|nr:alpha/beta fold hydrolase [Pedobacter sp. BAL39]EDM37670.1 hypothetical protein PBAL39_14634 [Pedobacter sp. BAL39]
MMKREKLDELKTAATTSVVSVGPVVLAAVERGEDLQVRISAPATGTALPIILFAHGYGSSLNGYAPLVSFWASRGFVVIQPTFLDSRTLALPPEDPRTPSIWKIRVDDIRLILDQLDFLETTLPGLKGRMDKSRIAAVGHSFGSQTTGMLLGARVIGADGKPGKDLSDSRIKAGILLTPGGKGGDDLSPFAAEHFPFMNPSYAEMITPSLVVAGDKDDSPLTLRGWDWFTDAYRLSPAANALVTLFGGEHLLGGISGYLVTETTDENPERVAAVQRLTWAYLRTALYPGDPAWTEACNWLLESQNNIGTVERR